jgi:orotate phosphoribosyltransferase
MQNQNNASAKIAEFLLDIHAVKLSPQSPFTWTSGWKSPIYSDNRLILSHVLIRKYIKNQLGIALKEHFNAAEAIIGVATAGIAPGAILADEVELPFGYVRSEAKKHGMGKQVEGDIKPGTKVVVVEDLISTGKSSLHAIQALREFGCEVIGLISIFNYGFEAAKNAFDQANCPYISLTNYTDLIDVAIKKGLVQENQLELLNQWRQSPSNWAQD